MAGYLGNIPTAVPLSSADIADGIITSAKIADGTIVNDDINASAGVVLTKLASTGTLTVDNIQFPATAVASANANNLDDYEEGTWTPSVGGTATYNSQVARYTKVGRLVNVSGRIGINAIGTGSSTTISGLPFTNGNSQYNDSGSVTFYVNANLSVMALSVSANPSTTNLTFFGNGSALTGSASNIALLKDAVYVDFQVWYSI
jgi:hypothetical protein